MPGGGRPHLVSLLLDKFWRFWQDFTDVWMVNHAIFTPKHSLHALLSALLTKEAHICGFQTLRNREIAPSCRIFRAPKLGNYGNLLPHFDVENKM